MTLQVDLGPDLERALADLLASGAYASQEDVLKDGVRVLHQQAHARAALRTKLMSGVKDAEEGRLHDLDEVFDELEARYS